ncbi:hypothetical protein DNI29_03190 [Hymenobacter sediminis]|uniref:hypothetical protein n=1 Tax=Hymenobacter sediminis TaxID=2218621 RepID=UPI000F4F0C81|nr:hypothetical protein [Hymenobacter sediminis]RPD49815.1 hypothetical protein DNI29_03190 [Hymenobacter sediminis]
MLKHSILPLGAALVLATSCTSWKYALTLTDSTPNPVHIAIQDFINNSPLRKEDSIFSVTIHNYKNSHVVVHIYGGPNRIWVLTNDRTNFSYSNFPTNYTEAGGKLFYWKDSTGVVTHDIIRVLTKYQHIDTAVVNVFMPDRIIDHTKQAEDYYFCKNNLGRYKKVRTRLATGYYKPPKVKCK